MALPVSKAAGGILAGRPGSLSEARRRISELSHLNAFIAVSEEEGEGPIVAVKDLIDVAGMVTTGGGRILPEVAAPADAPVIEQLRAYDCVVVGKTNLHEWAYGSTSINPHYGPVRNPLDPALMAGGSSGGSAVAVACGMCDWALGTDTAGSLRIPASLCGIVSIKPTYGSVATEGVIPLSTSLDTVGPMASDVATAASALAMMTGGARQAAPDLVPLSDLRIGRVSDEWALSPDGPTGAAWAEVARRFPEVRMPERTRASALCTTISMYEASQVHRRWLEEGPDRYGDADVRDRLLIGLEIPREEYEQALAARPGLTAEHDAAMAGWDAILAPATAAVAQPITAPDVREPMTRFTRPFAATGQPVITIPAPTTGLPVGVQVVGRTNNDATAVQVALALEVHWR